MSNGLNYKDGVLTLEKCKILCQTLTGGYTRAAVAPPYAIIPEQVLRRHRSLSAGAELGDRHCPLLHPASALNFKP